MRDADVMTGCLCSLVPHSTIQQINERILKLRRKRYVHHLSEKHKQGLSGNPNKTFTLSQDKLKRVNTSIDKLEERLWKKYGRHIGNNAFDGISFGKTTTGIHGHTLFDAMHSIRHGPLKDVLLEIFDSLGTKGRVAVDQLSREFLCNHRSALKSHFPRVNFTKGITNLTKITASENVGVMFTLTIILVSTSGREYLSDTFSSSSKRKRKQRMSDNSGKKQEIKERSGKIEWTNNSTPMSLESFGYFEVLNFLEMILCFDAWTHYGPFLDGDVLTTHGSISSLIEHIKQVIPRDRGNGWKKQKLHEWLLLPSNIDNFGHPQNFDTNRGENHLKTHAKKLSRTVNKNNVDNFQRGCAERAQEQQNLNAVFKELGQKRIMERKMERERTLCLMDNINQPCTKSAEDDNPVTTNKLHLWEMKVSLMKRFIRSAKKNPKERLYLKQRSVRMVGSNKTNCVSISNLVFEALEDFLNQDMMVEGKERIAAYRSLLCNRQHVTVHGFSENEHKFRGKDTLLRSHPNYQSSGLWYDWVHVNWWNEEEQCNMKVPAKILCLFNHPTTKEAMGVFHCTDWRSSDDYNQGDTVLTRRYHLEYTRIPGRQGGYKPNLRVCEMDCVLGAIYAFQNSPGFNEMLLDEHLLKKSEVIVVLDRKDCWGELFINGGGNDDDHVEAEIREEDK